MSPFITFNSMLLLLYDTLFLGQLFLDKPRNTTRPLGLYALLLCPQSQSIGPVQDASFDKVQSSFEQKVSFCIVKPDKKLLNICSLKQTNKNNTFLKLTLSDNLQ